MLNSGQHRSKYTQYKQTNRQLYRSEFYCNARQKSLFGIFQ